MTTTRKIVDWEAVERDYRTGIKTLRAMAQEHGITHGAINKKAQKEGWERDLSARLKKPVDVVEGMERLANSGFIYVIYMDDTSNERFYKVGMCSSLSERFGAHQCSSPFRLFVACAFFVGNMREEERFLHDALKEKRVRGEWFKLDDDDLKFISKRSKLI